MVEAVYRLLSENAALTENLAAFGQEPAVFYQSAPDDTDPMWGPKQCPRLVYTLEMQGDPERHTSGRLTVDILTDKNSCEPEDLDQIIRCLLSGVFFTDASKTTYAVLWDRSDLFDEFEPGKGTTARGILGITAVFDVVEFPVQLTTDPDPVQAMHLWSKGSLNNVLVVGCDALPPVWKPTGEQAAIYWHLNSIGPAPMIDSWTVSWHGVQLAGHILADHTQMQSIAKVIIDALQQAGEVLMADDSPMFVTRIVYSSGADPIKQGQITLSATYGTLRKPQFAPFLNKEIRYENLGGNH